MRAARADRSLVMEAVVGTSRLAAQREPRDAGVGASWFHSHGRIWVPFPEVDNFALEEAYGRVHAQLAGRRATQGTSSSGAPPARSWLSSSFWSSRTDENLSQMIVCPTRSRRCIPRCGPATTSL